MENLDNGVRQWLARNQSKMISCPYQPGQLMISKHACSKRHLTARQENYEDLLKGDLFNYSYKSGLVRCRECPIGKKLILQSQRPESARIAVHNSVRNAA
jgi:hypothetical protein